MCGGPARAQVECLPHPEDIFDMDTTELAAALAKVERLPMDGKGPVPDIVYVASLLRRELEERKLSCAIMQALVAPQHRPAEVCQAAENRALPEQPAQTSPPWPTLRLPPKTRRVRRHAERPGVGLASPRPAQDRQRTGRRTHGAKARKSSSQQWRPSPVAFDFVIGKSSVQSVAKPKLAVRQDDQVIEDKPSPRRAAPESPRGVKNRPKPLARGPQEHGASSAPILDIATDPADGPEQAAVASGGEPEETPEAAVSIEGTPGSDITTAADDAHDLSRVETSDAQCIGQEEPPPPEQVSALGCGEEESARETLERPNEVNLASFATHSTSPAAVCPSMAIAALDAAAPSSSTSDDKGSEGSECLMAMKVAAEGVVKCSPLRGQRGEREQQHKETPRRTKPEPTVSASEDVPSCCVDDDDSAELDKPSYPTPTLEPRPPQASPDASDPPHETAEGGTKVEIVTLPPAKNDDAAQQEKYDDKDGKERTEAALPEGNTNPRRKRMAAHATAKAPRTRPTSARPALNPLAIDWMGISPSSVLVDYSNEYRSISDILCCADASRKEWVLRETMHLFKHFCEVMQPLQVHLDRFQDDSSGRADSQRDKRAEMRAALQTCLQALPGPSSSTGLYGLFLRGILQPIDRPPANGTDKDTDRKPLGYATLERLLSREDDLVASAVRQQMEKDRQREEKPLSVYSLRYYRVVQHRTEVYDIVTRALHQKDGWEELPHGLGLGPCWNLLWTWGRPRVDYSRLLQWQKVNHYPHSRHLTRKDYLKRCIERYVKMGGKAGEAFRIMPLTFTLPKEYVPFVEAFSGTPDEERDHRLWILKPAGSSRGRGIQIINDLSGVTYGEQMVIQEYIRRPLLLEGFKFDLRVYVLVTSFQPLEAFVYKRGFARIATVLYSADPRDIHNRFIHLTNSSIQRHNMPDATQPTSKQHETAQPHDEPIDSPPLDVLFGGTKISLDDLTTRLEARGIDWADLWRRLCDVVLKSLCCCQDFIPHQRSAFELFGYDILIDERLKPWLLEVNASPSLGQEHVLDEKVKLPLISDTIDLVAPLAFDRQKLVQVLSRRLEGSQKTSASVTGVSVSGSSKIHQQLMVDINAVLNKAPLRRPGELPGELARRGDYECIAPSRAWDGILKVRRCIFGAT
ncbi:unnamed protein product [Vitrella brassicaformis CCMP3155]|uniref:Tubulin--tyrosine ligase-like protein 9 n=3 Tax=Vitrella brassicaformis TaxID=1169539 RepID=A0A0G4EKS8_VITBC|nr:unnamed protein product [Vitrella brassicaformis CCMP3155]|eukprot:CEL97771.1 unnamed protein product [Vitrella brassicaformis CCMP3155]